MDPSARETVTTDTLGRRTGPRRSHSIEEKLQIVKETHMKGASVASVARRHEVNPNQVFAWRQLYRRGLLDPNVPETSPPLLPVKLSTPTVLPIEPAAARAPIKAEQGERGSRVIEVKLANGHSIVVRGRVHAPSLARVIDVLVRR